MRFTFNGKVYSLEFSRNFKPVDPIGKNSGKNPGRFDNMVSKLSKFPYTVATIYEVVEDQKGSEWPIVVDAEVGCLVGADQFTLESGRLYALKKLTKTLDKDFKSAVWNAYINRPRQGKVTKKALRSLLDQTVKALKVTQDQLKAAQEQIITLRKDEGSY